MKKLVTAFAACIMAGLVSAQQVESDNIVGYTTKTGANGATMYAPMFMAVGGGANTLGSIKGDFIEYTDTLQILDENLATVDLYTWIDVTYSGAQPVWTSNGTTDDSSVVIPTGYAVVISSSAAPILNSGEVKRTATVVTCGTGASTLGNPLPRQITLGDITFDGLVEYTDTLQILDENLATVDLYTWIDVTYLGAQPVWTSDGSTDNSSVQLDAGDGFVLSSQNGCTVTFPAAL